MHPRAGFTRVSVSGFDEAGSVGVPTEIGDVQPRMIERFGHKNDRRVSITVAAARARGLLLRRPRRSLRDLFLHVLMDRHGADQTATETHVTARPRGFASDCGAAMEVLGSDIIRCGRYRNCQRTRNDKKARYVHGS